MRALSECQVRRSERNQENGTSGCLPFLSLRYNPGVSSGGTSFRAAVRIHAPVTNNQWAKTKEEEQYHSWDEVQTVTFSPSFAKEEMELTITNVWGGSFTLYNTRQAPLPW